MANTPMRSLNDVLRDGTTKNLTDAERSIRHKNAKKFVQIFLNANLAMKKALSRDDTKILIRKMMLVLAIKDINKTTEKDEANKALLETIKTILNNKRNLEKTINNDTVMEEAAADQPTIVIPSEENSETPSTIIDVDATNTDNAGTPQPGNALEALLATNNPRQPRRSVDDLPTLPHSFKFECRFELISVSEEDRVSELREKYNTVMRILRKGGTQAYYLPLNDAEGKRVSHLSSQKGRVTFARDDDSALPNLAAYGSEWLAKKPWMTVTATFHITCSVGILQLYMSKAKGLLKKFITMNPRRVNMRYECNVPVAVVLPSFASIDAKGLSFYFHEKHNLYITFELVKVVDGKWVQCGFKDDLCLRFAIIARGDNISETIKHIKAEWPFSGRRMDSYPLGFKMAAFPLDHNLNIHQMARDLAAKEKKDILLSMHADYQHSRMKVIAGGGAIYMKFLASVESCSLPITTLAGKTTNLREIITSFIDAPTGKPMIANVSPMPSQEDAGSVYTNFTTHRAANDAVTEGIAKRAEEFVRHKMANAIWEILSPQEAKKVLAASICGMLAMATSVTLEVVAEDMPIFPMEGVDAPELDDNSVRSEYANASVSSGITMDSGKTTGSTRAKLVETQDERDRLEEQNKELQDAATAKQQKMEQLIAILQNQQLDESSTLLLAQLTDNAGSTTATSLVEASPIKKDSADTPSGEDIQPMDDPMATNDVIPKSRNPITPNRIKKTAMKTTQSSAFSQGVRRSQRQQSIASLPIHDGGTDTRGASNTMAAGIG